MPYAEHQGLRIYYEVEGEGPPILLAHGLTGDTTFWRAYGYVEPLKDQFNVILFDARGHGRSDKPHEPPAYDLRLMAGDGLAVLDALGVGRAHVWGYSMGAAMGIVLAQQSPERLTSLMAGGVDPLYSPGESVKPSPFLKIFRRGLTEGADAVVEGMRAWAGSMSPYWEQRLRGLDLRAMVAYLDPTKPRTRLANGLPQMNLPCLLYAGELEGDAHRNGPIAAHQMPDARFVSLPGLDHGGAGVSADLILPHVLAFLATVQDRSTRLSR
jgi:pimeloyl-ACP methyl ester carboxylesterase